MANTADDLRNKHSQSGRGPNNGGQRSSKKKKHQGKVNSAKNTAMRKGNVELVSNNQRTTVAMSSHEVEITRAAIRQQEALEKEAVKLEQTKTVASVNPEVKDDSASKKVESISNILEKSSEAKVVSQEVEKTDLDVAKKEEVKQEKQTPVVEAVKPETKAEVKIEKKEESKKEEQAPLKAETSKVFEVINATQPEQFKPILIEDKNEGSSWFARLFLLAVVALCVFVVMHFLRNGMLEAKNEKNSNHVDAYAVKNEEISNSENVSLNGDAASDESLSAEEVSDAALLLAERKLIEAEMTADEEEAEDLPVFDSKVEDVKEEIIDVPEAAEKTTEVTEVNMEEKVAAGNTEVSSLEEKEVAVETEEDESVKLVKTGLLDGLKRSNSKLPAENISALIAKKSVDAGISPVLITSVVMAESYFDPKAVAKNGKKGLMQISSAKEMQIKKLQGEEAKVGDLFDPEYNLDLGVWYLKHLMNKYDGNLSKALMAFSWDEETLQKVVEGEAKAPRWAGLYYANIQRYYNAILGGDGQKIVLSIPTAERTLPEKVTSIEVAEDSAKVIEQLEEESWVKAVRSVGKHVSPQTKTKIISVIKEQSLIYGMDPAYIAAVIMSESAFDPLTVSKQDKRGLFQMKPEWARLVASTLGVTWLGDEALFEPEFNIELGVAYLQHLKLLFDDDLEKTAIAFNLTPYRVSRILAGKKKLPASTELYVGNIKKHCQDYGCQSEISNKYLDRLKSLQAK